jgi:hypothetical protein
MARAFADMQLEVMERIGRDDSRGALRVRQWINNTMHSVDQEGNWEYLLASTTGVAPLTVADLDRVETVIDVAGGNPLMQIDRNSLAVDVVDLTTLGTAIYWYRTGPTVIATYPVSTATLTVRYFKFGADLVAPADAPLMPDRFRQIIVEGAVAQGLRASGDVAGAAACMQEYQRVLQLMFMTVACLPQRQQLVYSSEDA